LHIQNSPLANTKFPPGGEFPPVENPCPKSFQPCRKTNKFSLYFFNALRGGASLPKLLTLLSGIPEIYSSAA